MHGCSYVLESSCKIIYIQHGLIQQCPISKILEDAIYKALLETWIYFAAAFPRQSDTNKRSFSVIPFMSGTVLS